MEKPAGFLPVSGSTEETARCMAGDFCAILELEQAAADSGSKPRILESLKLVLTPAVRVMYMLFEADSFRPSSAAGLQWLHGLLHCLPDSKLVEDCHGILRLQNKAQKNRRQTVHQMMELLTTSRVLDQRAIPHKPAVDRQAFLSQFRRTPDRKRKRRDGILPKHIVIVV